MSTDHSSISPPIIAPSSTGPAPASRSAKVAQPAKPATPGRAAGLLSLLAVTLATGGIVAGAQLIPVSSTNGPLARALPLSLGAPALACPGPETLTVPAGGKPVAVPGPVQVAALAGSSHGLAVAGLMAHGKGSQLAAAAAGKITTTDRLRVTAQNVPAQVASLALNALGPVVLAAQNPPGADPAPQLAATQSTLARTGDLRGLAAVPCLAPVSSSWLVGGGTGDGERLRLLLSNPVQTPAVVDVEVHGPQGLVPAPAGDGVVVPGERTIALYVDALAPGLDRVAVHVSARSGRVVATLHDSLLRGLVPGGTDDVSATADASTRQIIPGVSLVNGYAKTSGDPAAPGSASVRIAVPGSEEAVATVRLVDASGMVNLPAGAVVNVPAGGVADVPLAGVPSRTYTAIVESDVPIVAGARVGRSDPLAAPAAADFAWAAAATSVQGTGYAVLPPGTETTLSLVAATAPGMVRVREVMADGQLGVVQEVSLPAGTSAAIKVSDQAVALRIEQAGPGPVQVSMVSTADDPRGPLITVPTVRIDTAAAPRSSAVPAPRLGLG